MRIRIAFRKWSLALKVACYPQSTAAISGPAVCISSSLWELALGRPPRWRLSKGLTHTISILPYQISSDTGIVERSVSLGLTRHFATLLDGANIAQQVGLALSADLVVRLAERLTAASREVIGLNVEGTKVVAREVVWA